MELLVYVGALGSGGVITYGAYRVAFPLGSRYGVIGRWLVRCVSCAAGWVAFAAVLLATGRAGLTSTGTGPWADVFVVGGFAGLILGTLWPIAQTRRRIRRGP